MSNDLIPLQIDANIVWMSVYYYVGVVFSLVVSPYSLVVKELIKLYQSYLKKNKTIIIKILKWKLLKYSIIILLAYFVSYFCNLLTKK